MNAVVQRLRAFIFGIITYVKRHWRISVIAAIVLCLVIWAVYLNLIKGWGWADWTGLGPYVDADGKFQRGKTLWDWMELLIVPFVLAAGAIWLERSERSNDQKRAEERARVDRRIAEKRNQDVVLQTYLDKMDHLIFEEKLLGNFYNNAEETNTIFSNVGNMARIRTVTAIRQLNGEHLNLLIQFLRDANLNSFILSAASLIRVDFNNTDLSKIVLIDADLSEANLKNAHLTGCVLLKANLKKANLCRVDASSTILRNTDFCEADLSEANLDDAIMVGTNLTGACLDNASLINTNLSYATLDNAGLIGANLARAKLNNASLYRVSLCRANLYQSDLSNAYLREADFSGADLRGALFFDADLSNANLSGVKVHYTQLAQANSLEGAIMPDGKKYNSTPNSLGTKKQ